MFQRKLLCSKYKENRFWIAHFPGVAILSNCDVLGNTSQLFKMAASRKIESENKLFLNSFFLMKKTNFKKLEQNCLKVLFRPV